MTKVILKFDNKKPVCTTSHYCGFEAAGLCYRKVGDCRLQGTQDKKPQDNKGK